MQLVCWPWCSSLAYRYVWVFHILTQLLKSCVDNRHTQPLLFLSMRKPRVSNSVSFSPYYLLTPLLCDWQVIYCWVISMHYIARILLMTNGRLYKNLIVQNVGMHPLQNA